MRSRAVRIAALVTVIAASSPSRGAVLVSPVEFQAAPVAAIPASFSVPSAAAAPALGLSAAPSLGAPMAAPAPLAAAAVPLAAAPAAAVSQPLLPAAAASPARPSDHDDSASASAQAARMWDGSAGRADVSAPDDALISGGASPGFLAAVRGHIERSFPPVVLGALRSAGYRVEVDAHVRQNHPELEEKNDLISGYHAHGPAGKSIIIGETVRGGKADAWEKSRNWENAVNHEFGLALNRTLGDAAAAEASGEQAAWYREHGVTESPEFRAAWRKDFDAMPPELKNEKDGDGEFNDFYYFLTPDKEKTFHEARERTFAEGLDVAMRGPASAYNYDDFTLHFPNTLAQIRRELETRLGWSVPKPAPAPERRGPWLNPAATREQLAVMLVSGAARPEFVAKVRALVARTFPPELIRDLLQGGYRIAADRSVRQGREGLHADNDTRGGFHSHGANGNLIVVAEQVKLVGSERWVESEYWENAVIHEIGHALAYLHGEAEALRTADWDSRQARWYRRKGLSESPAFREAWKQDFEAMPAELKAEWTADKLENKFYYYVHPDPGGWYQRARQETYAEGFDVLLRGERSTYNHANFTRHFPKALAELRRELGSRYPGLFKP
jgi:hypothetical protein